MISAPRPPMSTLTRIGPRYFRTVSSSLFCRLGLGWLRLERAQFGFCQRSFEKRPAQRAPSVAAWIGLLFGGRHPVRPRVFPLDADTHDLIAHNAGVIGLAVEGHI